MTLDDLRGLVEKISNDASQVSDEELAAARDAIQEHVAEAKKAGASPDTVKLLTDLKPIKDAIVGEVDSRTAAKAELDGETQRLLAEYEQPAPEGRSAAEEEGDAEVIELPTQAQGEPAAVAASAELIASITKAAVEGATQAFAALQGKPGVPAEQPAEAPQGRTGRVATTATPAAPRGEFVTAKVFGGQDAAGTPIDSSYDLAKALHDKYRTVYQDSAYSGRIPIAHVAFEYPESRKLGTDAAQNFHKLEALTSRESLTAAGGLCAPLTPDYNVEVIGTSARPIRDQAMVGVQVERGGLLFRPPLSGAAAVNGAGQWTLDDDEAASVVNDSGPTKACYEVDCPGMEEEFIWAAYLCLEFSNITTRFDPETTAANLRQGDIAHSRLAENLLLSKMMAGSKALSGPRVIGATRDILGNIDRSVAYLRSRHRIDEAMPLTWVAPFWTKHMVRADLARQMAAGDWKDALGVADSELEGWFSRRNVSPVWHMDGIAGTDEVQTVTITGSPTGGTFTLSYAGDTTDPIAYNATAAQVKAALAALDTLDAEDITVTGGPGPGSAWVVTFGGSDSDGVNVAQMTSAGSFTGGSSPAVAVATTTGGDGAITVNGISIPSQTYDDAAAGSAIPGFPNAIDSLLYPTGTWAFLNGGSLDLGLVRDSQLNARNRYRQFQETFEGAAHRGVESLRLVMAVQPTGQTSGTKDLDAIVD